MVQAVELKFNCFFLMPVVDSFPTRLREELEAAYEEDIDEVGHAGIHCVSGLWFTLAERSPLRQLLGDWWSGPYQ